MSRMHMGWIAQVADSFMKWWESAPTNQPFPCAMLTHGQRKLIHEDFIKGTDFLGTVRYHVPKFPHSSATFNIISGSRILTSPKVLQGALGDSTCPMQCSQPCPMPANRHLTGLTWLPIVLYYIK